MSQNYCSMRHNIAQPIRTFVLAFVLDDDSVYSTDYRDCRDEWWSFLDIMSTRRDGTDHWKRIHKPVKRLSSCAQTRSPSGRWSVFTLLSISVIKQSGPSLITNWSRCSCIVGRVNDNEWVRMWEYELLIRVTADWQLQENEHSKGVGENSKRVVLVSEAFHEIDVIYSQIQR